MTLIAFATYDDHAVIVADTAGYGPGARRFLYSTKIDVLAHLDAVFAAQGDHAFAVTARGEVGIANDGDFDSLVQRVPDALRQIWAQCDASERPTGEASAFLIGYSAAAEEFQAFRFLGEHDFETERVEGPHIMPTPFGAKLPDYELERLAKASPPEARPFLKEWAAMPEYPMPDDYVDWAVLAKVARKTRALQSAFKVIVAGKLIHCRLQRGVAITQTVFEFDDHGDELDELVAGTLHPRAQIGPCSCKSGKPAIECHLGEYVDKPCPCNHGDGKTFVECCMVTDEERVAQAASGSLL